MDNDDEDPTAQFDAFRARQAEEREQQEIQNSYTHPTERPDGGYGHPEQELRPVGGYTFPPEYAAEPDAPRVRPMPAAGPPGGANRDRWTPSVLVLGAVLLAVCVLALGAWLALGSSSSSANAASTGPAGAGTASAARSGADAAKRALTFRVTIASVGSDSFTGKVLADGQSVTVTTTSATRYGTKARAFSRSDLTVGETVIVRGRRTGTAAITATEVAANVAGTAKSTASATGAAG